MLRRVTLWPTKGITAIAFRVLGLLLHHRLRS